MALYLDGGELTLSQTRKLLFIAFGLAIVMCSAAIWDRTTMGSITPIVCYPSAAVGVTLILVGSLGFRPLAWRPFVELGKRSYGLYVYHSLGFYLAMRIVASRKGIAALIAFRFVALALTIIIAWLSYALLERQFLKLKGRFTVIPSRDIPSV